MRTAGKSSFTSLDRSSKACDKPRIAEKIRTGKLNLNLSLTLVVVCEMLQLNSVSILVRREDLFSKNDISLVSLGFLLMISKEMEQM